MKKLVNLKGINILSKKQQKLINGMWGWTGICVAKCEGEYTVICEGATCTAYDWVGCFSSSGNKECDDIPDE